MRPSAEAATAGAPRSKALAGFDVTRVRDEYPILRQQIHGKSLVYLDNAATTQKPQAVLDAVRTFYEHDHANINRGVHELSQRSTALHEEARRRVQRFLGAESEKEIVFVRGTTEGINLVAQTWGRANLGPGDEILITTMEHHSNIVPWQILCEQTGAVLRVAPISDAGELLMDELEALLTERTRLISVVHVSNALGTINPVEQIVELARERGICVLIDGAQAAPHLPVDVQAIGCDFYVFSGHKVYAPSGIGALWARRELLEEMPPYQGGGDMILSVTFERTVYNHVPHRFEAGTPNIGGAIGLATALDCVSEIGLQTIAAHEQDLLEHATAALSQIPGLRLIGTAARKASIISFTLEGVHPHDLGTVLDHEGVAVRTGHHCAQPVMERLGVPATARASLGVYNTHDDVEALVRGILRAREIFGLR